MTSPFRSLSCAIAGASCTNSVKSRPRMGSISTERDPTTVLVAVSSLSRRVTISAAVTVTNSETLAIFRLKLRVSVAPTVS